MSKHTKAFIIEVICDIIVGVLGWKFGLIPNLWAFIITGIIVLSILNIVGREKMNNKRGAGDNNNK